MKLPLVCTETEGGEPVKWLSKTPQDSDVIVAYLPHLAETQPHNDKKLQDWDTQTRTNQQTKAESQKPSPN
ncbi:hypothetical protein BSPWISOXPB_234 [uncultured Gammaproteobacteria bacterium]|nr:hypothetical protein BSPWISOXPB_234 [uncultured Gammaproteobacteria bacterium]